jgi:hypothetical protein
MQAGSGLVACGLFPRDALPEPLSECGTAVAATSEALQQGRVQKEGEFMAVSKTEKRAKSLERQLVKAVERNSIRKRSRRRLFGLPLYDVAFGPNIEKGELRGHAKGIVAIGDTATGALAVGGIASGGIAVGGLAFGLFSIGGVALGVASALGGVAIGAYAVGGVAIALKAVGGAEMAPGWFE